MTYNPVTPFRRSIDAAMLKHQAMAHPPLPDQSVDKWEVLRELGVTLGHFGVSDRALSVLQALLSFHPETVLSGDALVVYPSNASICARLNGMPTSTMRRHLGALVAAGLILRRDSPNGKRFARRYGDGKEAFGFDLTPLLRRFTEITAQADRIRAARERDERLRRSVSLMRRDLAGVADYGAEVFPDPPLWDRLSDCARLAARDLRRVLTLDELDVLALRLQKSLDEARDILDAETDDLSTNARHSGQHHQNSDKDSDVSKVCLEKVNPATGTGTKSEPDAVTLPSIDPDSNLPNIPLTLVLITCPEIATYSADPIRHWHQFIRLIETIRPMMGVSPSVWDQAVASMGVAQAAVVLAAMLERFTEIRSPAGYLRHLTAKSNAGAFSCGPMIMALLNKEVA